MTNSSTTVKVFGSIVFAMMVGTSANATCSGDRNAHVCSLPDCGSYELYREGRTTVIEGVTAAGEKWSRRTTKRGNKTITHGQDYDGTSFHSVTVERGNRSITTVRPSHGHAFKISCRGDDCQETRID